MRLTGYENKEPNLILIFNSTLIYMALLSLFKIFFSYFIFVNSQLADKQKYFTHVKDLDLME